MNAAARYGDSYTAKETAKLISELGVSKSKQSWGQLAVKSFLAGVYLSVGGLFLEIVAGGSPGLAANYPGIQRTIGAAVFPIGLIIIVIAGLELCTSNFMVLTVIFHIPTEKRTDELGYDIATQNNDIRSR